VAEGSTASEFAARAKFHRILFYLSQLVQTDPLPARRPAVHFRRRAQPDAIDSIVIDRSSGMRYSKQGSANGGEGNDLGKIDAFAVAGIETWFYSLDHPPPHLHAKRPGEWEIRVYFLRFEKRHLDFDFEWCEKKRGPNAGEKSAILEAVLGCREALLAEWNNKVCVAK
jgi:hypothetical protein